LFYSIWTFKTTPDGTQDGAKQLWPASLTDTTCPGTVVPGNNPTEATFCKMNKTIVSANKIAGVLESIKDMPGQIPQATWLTPLADSICRTISEVWPADANATRTVVLESDGGENNSNEVSPTCFGVPATNSAATGNAIDSWSALNKSKDDWGILPVGAWQANVLRRATRLNITVPPFAAEETLEVQKGPLKSADSWRTLLTVKVDAHYSLCLPTGDLDPVCVLNSTTVPLLAPLMASAPSIQVWRTDGHATAAAKASTLAAAPMMAIRATATSATATAATATRTPTILPAELGFFKTLASSSPKAKFRSMARDPSVVYGVTHKLAGDVDDSNCVDNADYSIVTQKDVWYQRAVQPLQIAIRADLNRDGWVNELDRKIVLDNWGKGGTKTAPCRAGTKPTP
jgi:hypothetical protein